MSPTPLRQQIAAADGQPLEVYSLPAAGTSSGRSVLLVHGSGCGWEYWDAPAPATGIMRYLSERGHAVFALQSRGYGDSAVADGRRVNAASIADDLEAVCRAIAPGASVCLAGHSSGGYPVMKFAARQPERVARIAVLGMPFRAISAGFAGYLAMTLASLDPAGNGYVENSHHRDLASRIGRSHPAVMEWYRSLVERRYRRIPAGVLADVADLPSAAQPEAVHAATMVVQGQLDHVPAAGDGAALFEAIASCDKSLVTVPGSWHLPFLEIEGSARVAALLDAWFRLPVT